MHWLVPAIDNETDAAAEVAAVALESGFSSAASFPSIGCEVESWRETDRVRDKSNRERRNINVCD